MRIPTLPAGHGQCRSSILSRWLPALASGVGGTALLAVAWAWYLRYELRTGFDKDSDVFLALPIPGLPVLLASAAAIGLLLAVSARRTAAEDRPALMRRWAWVLGSGGGLTAIPFYILPPLLDPQSAAMGLLWQVLLPLVTLLAVAAAALLLAGTFREDHAPVRQPNRIWRLAVLFFVLVHIPSLWFAKPWETFFYRHRHLGGDEPRYLLLTHSLAQDRDFNIYNNMVENHRDRYICWTNPHNDPGDAFYAERAIRQGAGAPHSTPEYWKGRRYGIERIGMPLLLAPAYKAGLKFFALHRYGVVVMLNLILTFSMVNIYLLAWRITHDRRSSLLAAITGGLSGPMLFYGVAAYTEPVSAALLVFALRRLHECAFPDEGDKAAGWFTYLTLALAIAYLPWVHEKMLMFSGVLVLMAAILARPPRRMLPAVVAILLASALLQARYYWMLYGQFTPSAVHGLPFSLGKLFQEGLWGLWLDQKRGILPTVPWAFAGLAGLAIWVRRQPRFAWWPMLMGGAFLIGTGSFGGWYGGTSAQPRYPVNIMPLLAVGLAVAWTSLRSRVPQALIMATAAAGMVQGVTAVLVPSFLGEHRAPFWRDFYPIVFRLNPVEIGVIGAWVVLLAWGWFCLARAVPARRTVLLPLLCGGVIVAGAGYRFTQNARPRIAAWNRPLVEATMREDLRFATFNKRIMMGRHDRALSGQPVGRIAVPAMEEAERLNAGLAVADETASNRAVARLAATAADTWSDAAQGPSQSLYEGNYRAIWRVRAHHAEEQTVNSPSVQLKVVAVAGDQVFNQIEQTVTTADDWTDIELLFALQAPMRGVTVKLLARGQGELRVDTLRLEHNEFGP